MHLNIKTALFYVISLNIPVFSYGTALELTGFVPPPLEMSYEELAVKKITGLDLLSPELRKQRIQETRMRLKDKAWVEAHLAKPENSEEEDVAASKEKTSRQLDAKVIQDLTEGNVFELDRVSESQLRRIMKSYTKPDVFVKTMDGILARKECHASAAAYHLALKSEESFPEKHSIDLAVALYRKVSNCQSEQSERTKFRLGLIALWKGEEREANRLFRMLARETESDLRPRSLYWALVTDPDASDDELISFREVFRREYFFTYHYLVYDLKSVSELFSRARERGSTARFRSMYSEETNSLLEYIEGLIALKENSSAQRTLTKAMPKWLDAEPEVRLYIAGLFHRLGDNISQFRLLSSVFKDDSTLVSLETLKSFYPNKHFELVEKYAEGVDPYFIKSLIRQESAFNERARSRVGAKGLMQLMPTTAWAVGRVPNRKLYDPQTNIKVGTQYFSRLLERYHGDAQLALAAYNAGEERADSWKKRYPTSNRMLFFDLLPFKETRDYVALISRNFFWYLNLYGEEPKDFAKAVRRGRVPADSSFEPGFFDMESKAESRQ